MNNSAKSMIVSTFVPLSIFSILSLLVLAHIIQNGNAFVKIISPVKNQLIPINSPINISGISKDTKYSDCKIMLVINKAFPYREVIPVDNFGKGDFSRWSYMLLTISL